MEKCSEHLQYKFKSTKESICSMVPMCVDGGNRRHHRMDKLKACECNDRHIAIIYYIMRAIFAIIAISWLIVTASAQEQAS